MRYRQVGLLFFIIISFLWHDQIQAEESRLMRFPDMHQDKIVFVYAGDLWLVPAEGGMARRLTSDVGMELFPKF